MQRSKLIYLSVGDDGGGPWAFARGLAGGLTEQMQKYEMEARFIIDGRRDRDNNHRDVTEIRDRVSEKGGKVRDSRRMSRDPLLWLPRNTQNFIAPERLEDAVLNPFPERYGTYRQSVNLSGVDLVIAVVDPCAIGAAKQPNMKPIKAIEVTDHTWDVTMRLVLEQESPPELATQKILDDIGGLYGKADRLYLWPEPIAPDVPFGVEAKQLGVDVRRLAGVIEKPWLGQNKDWSDIRSSYQIHNDFPTVCLSTGDQGPIKEILNGAIASYKKNPPNGYNVIIDSNPSTVFRSNVKKPVSAGKLNMVDLGSICDLLITRCGGGAINGAIANALPWISVLEPSHPQVNAIARCAEQMGLTRIVSYETVASDPRRFIEYELLNRRQKAANKTIRRRLYEFSWQAELRWADEVIRDFLM